jgi:hypothetical protein
MATNWKPNSTKTSGSKGGGTSDGGTIPIIPITGGGTTENPNWYVPQNVTAPPGVDPYYGISIYGLGDSTGGGSGGGNPPPTDQSGTAGSKGDVFKGSSLFGGPGYFPENEYSSYSYNTIMSGGTPMSKSDWFYWKNNVNQGTSNSGSGSGNSGSNSFKIARPNMTWENSLPSVIPGNGQEALNSYAPIPFTREANTPGASYIKPPLTYNNPYNTNPYLPTANPFALIANQSQAS